MKKFIQIILLSLIGFSTLLNGWEVSTHETITKIAVNPDDDSVAENLKGFVKTFGLENKVYKNEGKVDFWWTKAGNGWWDLDIFRSKNNKLTFKLSGTYIGIIDKILEHKNVNIGDIKIDESIREGKYTNLIQAGSILEDTQMTDSVIHARFNRHFYDPVKSNLITCDGLGLYACAKKWALDGSGVTYVDDNIFSWRSVVGKKAGLFSFLSKEEKGYLLTSIIGKTKAIRHTAQANLFVSLGFLSHLIEDMTQAAHVRDDMHAGAWYPGGNNEFEIWANKHFNTEDAKKQKAYNSCFLALKNDKYNPTSFDSLFTTTATWTNRNFFSDDTIPNKDNDVHAYPWAGVNKVEIQTQWFGNDYFVYTADSSKLDIPEGTPLLYGVEPWGPNGLYMGRDRYPMQYVFPNDIKGKVINNYKIKQYTIFEENANLVFPRAVSAVEGMINYLFRAKIYAYVDPNDSDKLIIKNVTNQNEIAQGLDTAFRDDTKIYIYYETKNGERKPLPDIGETKLSDYNKNRLANDDTITVTGLSSALSKVKSEINDDKTIIVALAGQMGGDGIGERAIAGAKLVFKNNASLLLSFDDSGSMGSQIEDAKQSALNLLPLFKDSNSSYIEVQAFNRSGISFTNDIEAVKNTINSIYSYGGTPLYESMISAANSAIAEKNRHPNNKVIMILYTDGIANDDYNKQNAINAISKNDHPEIDEVYLVFVNTGDLSGKQILEDIATRANRHFIYLQSVEQLASELQKVLQ